MSATPTAYVHIGVPKSGTTFLQRVLAANRRRLADAGVCYPGDRVDHFFPAQDVLGFTFRGHREDRVSGAWATMLAEVTEWPGDVIVSHELLGFATPAQIATVVTSFPGRRVVVVVTGRDLERQLPAEWQESVKNGSTEAYDAYLDRIRSATRPVVGGGRGFWSQQHLPSLLARWQDVLDADGSVVLVTTPPAGSEAAVLWQRFADVCGLEADSYDADVASANTSLGLVEAEFVRRLNTRIASARTSPDHRRFVKQDLAQHLLAGRRDARRLTLRAADRDWVLAEARAQLSGLASAGVQVVGDLDDLLGVGTGDLAWPTPTELDRALVTRGVAACVGLAARAPRRGHEDRPNGRVEDSGVLPEPAVHRRRWWGGRS